MALRRKWEEFSRDALARVLNVACVYELGDAQGETMKYGQSESDCRRRLTEQLGTTEKFRWQASKSPRCDEETLISEYEKHTGRLPPGNKQRPSDQWCISQRREADTSGSASLAMAYPSSLPLQGALMLAGRVRLLSPLRNQFPQLLRLAPANLLVTVGLVGLRLLVWRGISRKRNSRYKTAEGEPE